MKSKKISILIISMLVLVLSFALIACEKEPIQHNHEYGQWIVNTAPTEFNEGVLERHCTLEGCTAREIKVLPKLNQSDYEYVSVPSTYEEEGSQTYSISVDEQSFTFETKLALLPLPYGNWNLVKAPTLEEEGKIERIAKIEDKEYKQEKVLPKLNDLDYIKTVIITPSCQREGKDEYVYNIDKDSFKFEIINPILDHNYTPWHIVTKPTREFYGTIMRECQFEDCIRYEQKTLYTIVKGNVDNGLYRYEEKVAPTCSEYGEGTYIYDIDGQEIKIEGLMDKLPHRESEWIIEKPTTTKEGKAYKICPDCKTKYNETILPIINEENYTYCRVEPTCIKEGYEAYTLNTNETIVVKNILPINKANHNMGKWDIDILPTSETKGRAKRVCSICGDVEYHELGTLTENNIGDKEWQYSISIVQDSYNEATGEGVVEYTLILGKDEARYVFVSNIKAHDHNLGESQILYKPTSEITGLVRRYCLGSKECYQDIILPRLIKENMGDGEGQYKIVNKEGLDYYVIKVDGQTIEFR